MVFLFVVFISSNIYVVSTLALALDFCSLCFFYKYIFGVYFGPGVKFLFVVFISTNIFAVYTFALALYFFYVR